MNNNLVFNGDCPMMTGTWYNPETGDSFTVKDTFFQDNHLMIQATDGRMLDYNFIQSYIQSDKPINVTPKTAKAKEEIPAEVMALVEPQNDDSSDMLPDDMDLIRGVKSKPVALGNLNTSTHSTPEPQNVNNVIIERALKGKPIPSIMATVNWPGIPTTEIKLLTDMMGVTKDELITWYMGQLDITNIKKIVADGLVDYINNFFPKETKVQEPLPASPLTDVIVKNLNDQTEPLATSEPGPELIMKDGKKKTAKVKKTK